MSIRLQVELSYLPDHFQYQITRGGGSLLWLVQEFAQIDDLETVKCQKDWPLYGSKPCRVQQHQSPSIQFMKLAPDHGINRWEILRTCCKSITFCPLTGKVNDCSRMSRLNLEAFDRNLGHERSSSVLVNMLCQVLIISGLDFQTLWDDALYFHLKLHRTTWLHKMN